MDRLFASAASAADELGLRLQAAERAAARVGLPRGGWTTILFGVCWSLALALAVVEWRAPRCRELRAVDHDHRA